MFKNLSRLQSAGGGDFSVAQICESLNITPSTYYYWVRKLDIQTPYRASVKHNSTITKEQILELHNSGKKYNEILKILGISEDTYNTLLAKFGIKTDSMQAKKNISEITKERLENLIHSGLTVKKICEELNISERTYSRLLDKFGLTTGRKAAKKHIASIKPEMLQSLLDSGCSKPEICTRLKINDCMFYRLLKRFDIKYNYLHNSNEIKIPKQRLEELANSGKTVEEITKELGVSLTTYYQKTKEAGVKTVFRDSIDRIMSVPKDELQKSLDAGMTVKEICAKYKISEMNYIALIRKYNLATPQRISSDIISNVTKEQILALRNDGKKSEEICKELNISKSTMRRILSAGKNLEQT